MIPVMIATASSMAQPRQTGGNDGSDPSGDLLKRGDAIFGTTQGSGTGQSTVYRIIP
jgi:hypothetical protein